MQRATGILLHPTALPGPFRIGDLGKEAFLFIDFLHRADQSLWQLLPLGPTGYGHSPYNAISAFAGNPVLIDLQQLVDCGDLRQNDLEEALRQSTGSDFDQTHRIKTELLRKAGNSFFSRNEGKRSPRFEEFCRAQSCWLEDFSLFMAIRENLSGQSWNEWPEKLRCRQPAAMKSYREQHAESCRNYQYQQFVFSEQWLALKSYANQNGVLILGDIPIFVAYDSADVWANQELFQLDQLGKAHVVAGVPPDYFSKTGQRWGNPLYRWERLEEDGFQWWLRRFDHQLRLSDMVRIDHFRGFQACWAIPAVEETAIHGQWQTVPGRALFERLREQRGRLPIIAEDLGVITPEVEKLRDDFGFPGMKILQFAFDSGADNPYLPENHDTNCVVYTGTHDNDTTLGWWKGLNQETRSRIREYLKLPQLKMPWPLIELAMSSPAELCIIPCQDILSLGRAARFNTPGQATGNWSWQMSSGALTDGLATRLQALAKKYCREAER